jgi:hypothetical protein
MNLLSEQAQFYKQILVGFFYAPTTKSRGHINLPLSVWI